MFKKLLTFTLGFLFLFCSSSRADAPTEAEQLHKIGESLLRKQVGSELPTSHPLSLRVSSAVDDLVAVLATAPSDIPKDRVRVLGRVLLGFGFHESGLLADPHCPEGTPPAKCGDNGSAVGVLQIHVGELPKGILPPEWTASAIRKDRRLGFAVGLRVVRWFVDRCGTVASAMTAFATDGRCGKTIKLVADRCEEVGLSRECE